MFEKERLLEREQRKYRDEAKKLISNQQKLKGLLYKASKKANEKKGTLGEAWNQLQLFVEVVKAYSKGEYREVSTSSILSVIGALLYFLSPLDLIPDFIIGLGIVDDAAVIGYTLKKVAKELEAYKNWKKNHTIVQENPLD